MIRIHINTHTNSLVVERMGRVQLGKQHVCRKHILFERHVPRKRAVLCAPEDRSDESEDFLSSAAPPNDSIVRKKPVSISRSKRYKSDRVVVSLSHKGCNTPLYNRCWTKWDR